MFSWLQTDAEVAWLRTVVGEVHSEGDRVGGGVVAGADGDGDGAGNGGSFREGVRREGQADLAAGARRPQHAGEPTSELRRHGRTAVDAAGRLCDTVHGRLVQIRGSAQTDEVNAGIMVVSSSDKVVGTVVSGVFTVRQDQQHLVVLSTIQVLVDKADA